MKIKLSRNQWEEMGKKAGWMKTAQSLEEQSTDPVPAQPQTKATLNRDGWMDIYCLMVKDGAYFWEELESGRRLPESQFMNARSREEAISWATRFFGEAFKLLPEERVSFPETMAPGEKPYTEQEKQQVNKMVSDAAQGDPGEQNEL